MHDGALLFLEIGALLFGIALLGRLAGRIPPLRRGRFDVCGRPAGGT